MPPDNMGDENDSEPEEDGDNYLKTIQKLTGKLGEKLRSNQEEIVADDIKYVINSVLSALDLNKLEDSDKEDIISQIEDDEESGDENFGGEDDTNLEMPTDTTMPPPTGDESDLKEIDVLDELINTPFDFNDDEDKPYQDTEEVDDTPDYVKSMLGDQKFIDEPDDEDDIESPVDDTDDEEREDGEVCSDCHGTGVRRGKECPICHGEGIVFKTDELDGDDDISFFDDEDDLEDVRDPITDEPYDPIEMGEEDLIGDDSQTKEIDLNELTDMINTTVKERLSKYFE
jgi:hypothetical protein